MARKRRRPSASNASRTQQEQPQRRAEAFWLPRKEAGVRVDENVALTYSAVWAAVRVIAETLSALPFHVFQRAENGGKVLIDATPAAQILRRPNPEMRPFTVRELLTAHALTWGNGYAEIERDPLGRPRALWPIPPDRVMAKRNDANALIYEVRNFDRDPTTIPAADMFHLHGLGWDGLRGYSVIAYAARNLGLSVAAEQFGASFFNNGAALGGVLQHPGTLDDDGRAALRKSWESMYSGPTKAGRTAVLEEGMTYQAIGIPPDDAQFLQTREFQITDVCRWFRVPPHKLADLKRATFSNIEEQNIDFTSDTLVPWATRWEQESDEKIIGIQSKKKYFTKININGLLRGAIDKRFNAYAVGRQWGWLSANDVRRLEDMDPLPADQGDVYFSPMNMVPTESLGDEGQARLAPAETEPSGDAPPPAARNAFRPLFIDAATRALARETNRAKRAPQRARAGSEFAEYMRAYYEGQHVAFTASTFSVAAEAMAGLAGPAYTETVAAVVERYARRYCATNLAEITAAAAEGDLASFYERAESAWPGEVADELLDLVIAELAIPRTEPTPAEGLNNV